MSRLIESLTLSIRDLFADRLLQLLFIGVILAAFAAFFLDGAGLALGVLAVGGSTALIESKKFRSRRKRGPLDTHLQKNNSEGT